MCEKPQVNVEVEPVAQLLGVYTPPSVHCLYFIYARKAR